MTREELEKEAEFRTKGWKEQKNCIQAYLAGAEPREKRIAELEAQIKKMKCCGNCAHLCECGIRGYEECKNFDKWELREIKENVR